MLFSGLHDLMTDRGISNFSCTLGYRVVRFARYLPAIPNGGDPFVYDEDSPACGGILRDSQRFMPPFAKVLVQLA